MRRSTLLILVPVAAIAVFVASVTAGNAQNQGGETARLTEGRTTTKRIDNAPRGRSAGVGDVFVFSSPMSLAGRGRIGTHHGVCTVLASRPFRAQCSDTFLLPAGQLYTQGVFTSAASNRSGIVGGTGAYEVARGSVNITSARGGDILDFNIFR
jgi:hypothetical protein